MAADDDELHPGRVLGPYELMVPLGSGGMAHVFAARHRTTNEIFALKVLRPHLAENTVFRDMFFDEATIASRIVHANVCVTLELVELDGFLTIVMEWVDGCSLVYMLHPNGARDDVPLPLRHAVKIVGDTCAGLQAAHDLVDENGRRLNVVHRDVSPHNILITQDGRVKITDFGVAKALGKIHTTMAGQVKGKLAYMSPEQLVGGGIDRRSDVFALGTVLYELTTGHRPFTGEHDPQIMTAIIAGTPTPPSAVVRGYPRDLEKIVMHAIANSPNDRYPTAKSLKHALDTWLQTSGTPLRSQQVAQLLRERCGAELEERARQLATFAPSFVTSRIPSAPFSAPPSSAPSPSQPQQQQQHAQVESGSGMEMDRRPSQLPPPTKTRSGMGSGPAALAIVLGLCLGLGVLYFVREARRARVAAADARIAAEASAPVIAPPVQTISSSPVDAGVLVFGDLDDVVVDAGLRMTVKLRVPEGSRIFVDGKEQPPGTMTVSRPDAGVRIVLIKAEGMADAMTVIKPTTPDEVEVPLFPKPKKANPAGSNAVPPNPYE